MIRERLPVLALLVLCLVLAAQAGAQDQGAMDAGRMDLERMDQAGLIARVNASTARIVVVDFWATWCGPCLNEMPNLMRLREEYSEAEVDILGVSFDFDPSAYARYLEANPLNFPSYLGVDRLMWDLSIETIPEVWILDRSGASLGGVNGLTDYEELDRAIQAALAEQANMTER